MSNGHPSMICANQTWQRTRMTEMSQRLRQARIAAGFQSANSVGPRFGWKQSTYNAHEGGQNAFDAKTAAKYARAFGVSASWLLTGERDQTGNSFVVRVGGEVGLGGIITPLSRSSAPDRVVEVQLVISIPGGRVAYIVEGNANFPKFEHGMALICREPDPQVRPYIGKQCVVCFDDGAMAVRTIQEGATPGCYDLLAYNAPTIRNAALAWVAKVVAIVPGDELTFHERPRVLEDVSTDAFVSKPGAEPQQSLHTGH